MELIKPFRLAEGLFLCRLSLPLHSGSPRQALGAQSPAVRRAPRRSSFTCRQAIPLPPGVPSLLQSKDAPSMQSEPPQPRPWRSDCRFKDKAGSRNFSGGYTSGSCEKLPGNQSVSAADSSLCIRLPSYQTAGRGTRRQASPYSTL